MILDATRGEHLPAAVIVEMARRKSPDDIRTLTQEMIPLAHRTALHLARGGFVEYDDCLQSNVLLIQDRLHGFNPDKMGGNVENYIRGHLRRDALSEYSRMHQPAGRKHRRSRKSAAQRKNQFLKECVSMPHERLDHYAGDPRNQVRMERQRDLATALERYIWNLMPQERLIISKLFGLGCDQMTVAALASELDTTPERINRLKNDALQSMRSMGAKRQLRDFYQPEERS